MRESASSTRLLHFRGIRVSGFWPRSKMRKLKTGRDTKENDGLDIWRQNQKVCGYQEVIPEIWVNWFDSGKSFLSYEALQDHVCRYSSAWNWFPGTWTSLLTLSLPKQPHGDYRPDALSSFLDSRASQLGARQFSSRKKNLFDQTCLSKVFWSAGVLKKVLSKSMRDFETMPKNKKTLLGEIDSSL